MILMLAALGANTNIVYNYLAARLGKFPIVIENAPSRLGIVRRRAKRVGVRAAISQAAFVSMFQPTLRFVYRHRIEELCETHSLDRSPLPKEYVSRVVSINDDIAREKIRSIAPDVVIVNGTRIISQQTLSVINSTFINTHAGITPRYRGVHGGYWALFSGDLARCGVTVHVIDSGIDTGQVISQALINPSERDGFSTYPFLQLIAALPLLEAAVKDALEGRLKTDQILDDSKLWYHPTIGQYLEGRSRGVR